MTDELSPEREERLIAEMLRERGAIDPGRLGPVIDLAAQSDAAWSRPEQSGGAAPRDGRHSLRLRSRSLSWRRAGLRECLSRCVPSGRRTGVPRSPARAPRWGSNRVNEAC